MTNKQLYAQFCESNPDVPLFMRDWWLDAVCAGKQWDAFIEKDANGEICAALPYLFRTRARMNYIVMPQMTQIWVLSLRNDIPNDSQAAKRVGEARN